MRHWSLERRCLALVLGTTFLGLLLQMAWLRPATLEAGPIGFLPHAVLLLGATGLVAGALILVVLDGLGNDRTGILRILVAGWILLLFLGRVLIDQGIGLDGVRFFGELREFLTRPTLVLVAGGAALWLPPGAMAKRILVVSILGGILAGTAFVLAAVLTAIVGFGG